MFHGKFIAQTTDQISLAGKWQVKLDSLNIGSNANWASLNFQGMGIDLPGTLDDAGIGTPSSLKPALNNYVLSNLNTLEKHGTKRKSTFQNLGRKRKYT